MSAPMIGKILAFRQWVRSVRSYERHNYNEACKFYEEFRSKSKHELPLQRAFYANLLVLAEKYELAYQELSGLVSDLESLPETENNKYIVEFAKMLLSQLSGSGDASLHRSRALAANPKRHVRRLLPVGPPSP